MINCIKFIKHLFIFRFKDIKFRQFGIWPIESLTHKNQRKQFSFVVRVSPMNCTQRTFPTFTFPANHSSPKRLISPIFTPFISQTFPNPRPLIFPYKALKPAKKIRLPSRASSSDNSESPKWVKWLPTGALAADKVLRLIAGATASPIYQFVSSPTTFLHSVDPRVKLVCSGFLDNLVIFSSSIFLFDWDML